MSALVRFPNDPMFFRLLPEHVLNKVVKCLPDSSLGITEEVAGETFKMIADAELRSRRCYGCLALQHLDLMEEYRETQFITGSFMAHQDGNDACDLKVLKLKKQLANIERQIANNINVLPNHFASTCCVPLLVEHLEKIVKGRKSYLLSEENAVFTVMMILGCIQHIDLSADTEAKILRVIAVAEKKFDFWFCQSKLKPFRDHCEKYMAQRKIGNAILDELQSTTKNPGLIKELLMNNPEFSPQGRARVVAYLLSTRSIKNIDKPQITQLLRKGIGYTEINGHKYYYAMEPVHALGNATVQSMSDFITEVSQHSLLINLMGGWQVNQENVVYIRPSSSDTKRNDTLQCCHKVLQELTSIVDSSFIVPHTGIPPETLSRLTKNYSENNANVDSTKIRTIAQVAVTQLAKCACVLEANASAIEIATSLLSSVNDQFQKIISEESSFTLFEKIYQESSPFGSRIRVFQKRDIPTHCAYQVLWSENNEVYEKKVSEESEEKDIARVINALIEHMDDARILAERLSENDTPFVHSAKGINRTGKFLLLLELFRNKNIIKDNSDDEIRAFIHATMIQIGFSMDPRSDDRAVFDQRFIQAFRAVAEDKTMEKLNATSLSSAAAVSCLETHMESLSL